MSSKLVFKSCYCEKLESLAHLQLQYAERDNYSVLIKFDCDDARDCGVGKEEAKGSFTYNWDDCPVKKKFKKNSEGDFCAED